MACASVIMTRKGTGLPVLKIVAIPQILSYHLNFKNLEDNEFYVRAAFLLSNSQIAHFFVSTAKTLNQLFCGRNRLRSNTFCFVIFLLQKTSCLP